uniref:Uncharacterized protein n=1 Tax=Noccaea caerulescens TaxID=107243 RepID=A0A1J3K0E2_NOCCA
MRRKKKKRANEIRIDEEGIRVKASSNRVFIATLAVSVDNIAVNNMASLRWRFTEAIVRKDREFSVWNERAL